ncbi:unnamed protein product [Bursaphelenchus xylophilus]|uniref:(pine wood nematode) hypothetical protein n=1 Tax=Bursaphelenchus xylophilus TaxID=6326 RepID=A0A1I7RYU8_BURXY|nr:unnamed protein product [Bursaphelenchus xylophilus]CAG9092198.1 unnamed protein product [Bursaphelenchus xylophilus]
MRCISLPIILLLLPVVCDCRLSSIDICQSLALNSSKVLADVRTNDSARLNFLANYTEGYIKFCNALKVCDRCTDGFMACLQAQKNTSELVVTPEKCCCNCNSSRGFESRMTNLFLGFVIFTIIKSVSLHYM